MAEFVVNSSENGVTVGEILRKRGFSNRLVRQLKRIPDGITLDGIHTRTIDTARAGQKIYLKEDFSAKENLIVPNKNLDVKILYENSQVIVFDKPAFMPTHPSINHREDTLGNFYVYYTKGKTFRPVNRLDRDTSGCVLCAKTQSAAFFLQKNHRKIYVGITENIPFSGGRICAPIARCDGSLISRKITPESQGGKYAATDWLVKKRSNGLCLIEFFLETGRTHQIRVHMSHKGYPLVGDNMYGGNCTNLNRQALHCRNIIFTNPEDNKEICVTSPLPCDFENLLTKK